MDVTIKILNLAVYKENLGFVHLSIGLVIWNKKQASM